MNAKTHIRGGVAALALALASAGLAGCAAGGAHTVAIRKTGDVGGLATWMQCSSQQGCGTATPKYPNVPALPQFHMVPEPIPGCPAGGFYTFAAQVLATQQPGYGWVGVQPGTTSGTWVPASEISPNSLPPFTTRVVVTGEQCTQTTATLQVDPGGFVIDTNEASVPQDLTFSMPNIAGQNTRRWTATWSAPSKQTFTCGSPEGYLVTIEGSRDGGPWAERAQAQIGGNGTGPSRMTGVVPTYAGDTEFRALVAETSTCGQTGQATWSATATVN